MQALDERILEEGGGDRTELDRMSTVARRRFPGSPDGRTLRRLDAAEARQTAGCGGAAAAQRLDAAAVEAHRRWMAGRPACLGGAGQAAAWLMWGPWTPSPLCCSGEASATPSTVAAAGIEGGGGGQK